MQRRAGVTGLRATADSYETAAAVTPRDQDTTIGGV
jgi:hypothetical protein